MAPEYPPSLVIVDLYREQGELRFKTEYVERLRGKRLRVRWLEEPPASGFRAVGHGVAHVLETDDLLVRAGGEGVVPKSHYDNDFTWMESVKPDDPWRMLIIIFPQGEVALDLKPSPEGIKKFHDRLVTFWVVQGDNLGRASVYWKLKTTDADPLSAYRTLLQKPEEKKNERGSDAASPPPGSAVTDYQSLLFLCYSHEDESEKSVFLKHLRTLQVAARKVEIWSDDNIQWGQDWNKEIEEALHVAKAAVLLVTNGFLGSKYINGIEMPELLERKCKEGLLVFPVIAKHCPWEAVPWLVQMEVRPKNKVPIWSADTRDPDEILSKIVVEIAGLI